MIRMIGARDDCRWPCSSDSRNNSMTRLSAAPEVTMPFAQQPSVIGRLEQAREEQDRFRFWLGVATFCLGAMGIVALGMFIDWMWEVPAWLRALALPALAGLAISLFVRSRRPYSSRQAAADAERQFPELGQRVRTVVQYADPESSPVPASRGLLRALIRQTDKQTAALDFRKLVPWPVFERRAIGVFLALIVGLIALFASPSLRTAFLRALLLPAHYTTLKVEPGNLTLKAGETVKLVVTLDGRPVKTAQWLHRKTGGEWIARSLAPDAKPGAPAKPLAGQLTAKLEDCQEDFEYRVEAGEVESPVFRVKVVHPLLLKKLQATITPPGYTRQPPVVLSDGNWNATEGSRVDIQIALDRQPQTAELKLSAGGQPLAEKVELRIDEEKLSGVIASVTKDVDLEITATANDGMALEPEKRRIKVGADREPTVRFVQPEEALAVIPTTEVPVQVEARDDFGVSLLGIKFKIGDGPEETLHLSKLKDQPLTAAALETLYLEKYSLDHPGAITYYAFVEDNYSPKPHRVVSDLRFIDILPFKQEYQFVEGEGSCNGSSVSLEELIARQRDNLNRTFALEREPAVNDGDAKRLARYQGELHAATEEFAQGIAGIAGPVPALEKSVAAMQSATTALEAKDVATARPREEAALKELIAARQNLRKLLRQNSSKFASACRKFDRAQSQKLRRPPKDERKHQLAALEKDLRELAKREEKFSEQLEPNGSGGPQVDPPAEKPEAPKSAKKSSSKSSSQGSKSGSSSRAAASENAEKKSSLAEEQKQAAQDAERLNKLAQQDEAMTEDAQKRLGEAAEAVSESSRALDEARAADAARKAREAARRLASLSRQVGALKAKELSEMLARERDFAQEIARAERELAQVLGGQDPAGQSQSGRDSRALADRQRELADDTAALADVLEQIKASARLGDREIAQVIAQAESTSPPREIARAMRQNADAIGSGNTATAASDAASAAERLEALAQDLESARRAAAGPELERLVAAEKEAAALQERLRNVRQSSQQTGAERAFEEFAGRLDRLAPREGALRQAAENMTAAGRAGHGGWSTAGQVQDGDATFLVPPTNYTQTLAAAIVALQAKIQEMVLENTLVERNGPVPPQYKSLVDDYYRVLSQDLR
jgi:Domain of unknown function (DUF4175)